MCNQSVHFHSTLLDLHNFPKYNRNFLFSIGNSYIVELKSELSGEEQDCRHRHSCISPTMEALQTAREKAEEGKARRYSG